MRVYRVVMLLVLFCLASAAGWAEDRYKLKEGARGKLCLNCHVTFQDKMKAPFVHTPLRRGECSGCHNPHTSSRGKLLDKNADAICFGCHPSVIGKKSVSIHKVVAEGKCVQCHDPHSSQQKYNLLASGSSLCFNCHKSMGETVSQVKHRHYPVEKDCLTCHTPHASAGNKSLLKDAVPGLCAKCHKTDRPVFVKQHMNYPVGKSACTSCHAPHGSNQPGILHDTVHKPVANRMCNQCHEEASSPNALKTKKAGLDLCKACHTPMIKDVFDKKLLHWPVSGKKACQSCHTPHASGNKGLLRQSQSALCGSCHAETVGQTTKAKTPHSPVKEGACTACHSPHASDNSMLFVQPDIPGLCGSCHDWKKHSTHPIGEKYRDPRDKNLSVDCLSCHHGHGSEHKRLLLLGTVTEVCVQCHDKYRR
ncbi:MAG: cytochrome C [Nitrospirae bacterium GWD2_57_9]|nr:MAG: cytochrome C [Nitrospirae bacterium GWD2_57_9]OGW45739.1 MAG: cytochrome C [Nitrospirae bacterium GWC2_57_9]